MIQSQIKHSRKASAAESATSESLYLVTDVVCMDQRQLTGLFVWQSTFVQVADRTTDQDGDVRGVI